MPNAVPLAAQLFVAGAWTTYPGYSEEGWEYQIGPDIEAGPQASKLQVTLNNDDLSMDPSRVQSPLYGAIGQNTPARLQIAGTTVCTGEASDWEPDRSPEHVPGAGRGRAWTTVTAEGLLRRIGRWDDTLDSPMTRQLGSYPSSLGLWPLEDSSDAQSLANRVPGGRPGTFANTVTLSGDPGAGGAAAALELGVDGVVSGQFAGAGGNGWQKVFHVKLAAAPGSATYQVLMQWSDTLGRQWYVKINNTSFLMTIDDSAGTNLANISATHGIDPTKWTRVRIRVTVAGSTVTFEPAWYQQDAAIVTGYSGTFSSTTTAQPTVWTIPPNAYTNGAAYSHVFAVTDTSLDLNGSYAAVNSFNGYRGESPPNRFTRLLGENGFSGTFLGTSNERMGRQKPATLYDLLKEVAVTEAGLIYDDPTQVRLILRCYNNMIGLTPSLALVRTVNVVPPLRKKISDVKVVNDLTVENTDGSVLRLQQSTGGKNVQQPPAGVGRYRGKLEVSYASPGDLASRGNLELQDSTVDRPRYESVTVDLLANPGLRAAVAAMRPGDVITIAGEEPDVIPLRVLTINRKGGAVADSVTFSCRPADVWNVGVYDSTLYDLRTSTLTASAAAGVTTLSLVQTAYEAWSTTPGYDLLIAGERVTVTAMTASSGGPGAYTQTATVTRAVNGVAKTLPSGAEVHAFASGRYGL